MQNPNKPLKFLLTMFMTFLLTIVSISPTFLKLNFGSSSLAQSSGNGSRNYDSLYTSAVIMLRNAKYGHLLNIAEGPLGPNVVWSPGTVVQNNDNTIVVVKKEGVNIVQLLNRATRKVLGVNKSGRIESKLEVQNVIGKFNQYQSFYVDYLPNGNIYFSSVAFPNLVINLPWGGSNVDNKYQLYDKVNIGEVLESQFKVDLQGDGANTTFDQVAESVPTYVAPKPVVTTPNPVTPKPVTPTPNKVENQIDKLRTGAVVVLRNADLNQPVRVPNTANGNPIYGAPASNSIGDDAILVAVNKPGTNIYQFFNRKNGKVLSASVGGQVGDWVEVWNRVPGFNPYQSFYIDTVASNGYMVLSPVAFPSLALNLPEGGRSKTFQHYTLWSKENINIAPNRQFKVDVLGYGADTAMPKVATVNTPTTKTQFSTPQGVVKLVNNNPVGVVGQKSGLPSGFDADNKILESPLMKDPIFMEYYKVLPKTQNVVTQGNYCPEISRGEFTDKTGAYWIKHANLCGDVYTYLNRNAMYNFKGDAEIASFVYAIASGASATYTGGASLVIGAYPTSYYFKLKTDLETCLNKGGNSAWLNEYGYDLPLVFKLSCSN